MPWDHIKRDWVWWTVIGASSAGSFKDPYSRYQLSMTKCGGFLTLVSALRDLGVGCSTLRPDAHRNAEMPLERVRRPFLGGPMEKGGFDYRPMHHVNLQQLTWMHFLS